VTTIRWAPQAADDLAAIRDFIARDSPQYARLVCQRIMAKIEQLTSFPLMGRVVPELENPAVRELIVAPYRIVYRVRADVVEVATIFHAARLFPLDG
jgi:addiction module RelE/StbE family toxin